MKFEVKLRKSMMQTEMFCAILSLLLTLSICENYAQQTSTEVATIESTTAEATRSLEIGEGYCKCTGSTDERIIKFQRSSLLIKHFNTNSSPCIKVLMEIILIT